MQVGRDRRVACLDPHGSFIYDFGEIPCLPRGNRRSCLRGSPCGWRRHVQISDYWPVNSIAKEALSNDSLTLDAACIVGSVLLAALTYAVVEKPIRNHMALVS